MNFKKGDMIRMREPCGALKKGDIVTLVADDKRLWADNQCCHEDRWELIAPSGAKLAIPLLSIE